MTEIIKIIFFALGTFFGTGSNQIAADKTTVSIDNQTMIMVIVQENLFSIIETKDDSLNVSKALAKILTDSNDWRSELKDFESKHYELYLSEADQLNAKITLKYKSKADLKNFDIDLNEDGNFALLNNPKWNISSDDGQIDGDYWIFDTGKTFSFIIEPFKVLPAEYKVYKKSLAPIWDAIRE